MTVSALSEKQIDARLGELPPLAPAVRRLLALFDGATVNYAALEEAVRHEPVLAGRVLRLANSSFFGFAGRIGSLREACMVLGSQTLRQIVLAATAVENLTADSALLDTRALWSHALATAAIARRLAQTLGSDVEDAFTAGLLHDLGKLVLAAWFQAEYREALALQSVQGGLLMDAERTVLGTDHGSFGEKLARKWHFPETLAVAIGHHHDPVGDRLGDIVHVADVLAHALEHGWRPRSHVPPLQAGAWERLGLGWPRLEALLPELDRDAAEAARFELV